MDARYRRRLWWVAGSSLVVLIVGLTWAAYQFSWLFTGFVGKTLWDWLQLLIVPLVLAFGAVIFNQVNTDTERQIAKQRYEQDQASILEKQREDLLQGYLDRMSELLLERNLRISRPEEEVRTIARVRTIGTLIQLDRTRVNYVFAFLREADLMKNLDPIISLHHADLSKVKWIQADLREVDLREADLREANLSGADLREADLSGADLRETNLRDAKLRDAKLSAANLSKADLREAILRGAILREAIFSRTDLSGADLSGADFFGANLFGANLTGAKLSRTDLSGANLTGANLTGANLTGANLMRANLSGADLSKTNFKQATIENEKLSAEQQAQAIWT